VSSIFLTPSLLRDDELQNGIVMSATAIGRRFVGAR